MLTQKYKQQQQQVRVQTSESNYAKGMFFSDAPLAEGYSKVLVNWDIDETVGKLTPRKGLRTIDYAISDTMLLPTTHYTRHNHNLVKYFYNTTRNSKVSKDFELSKHLLDLYYLPSVNKAYLLDIDFNIDPSNKSNLSDKFNTVTCTPFNIIKNDIETTVPGKEILNAGVHGLRTKAYSSNVYNVLKPVATYAYGNSVYMFVNTYKKVNKDFLKKLGEFPDANALYDPVTKEWLFPTEGDPGGYYIFSKISIVVYYDTSGNYRSVNASEEEFLNNIPDNILQTIPVLCYTKQGKDIQTDDVLFDETVNRNSLIKDHWYICEINPQKLNPTEAASWGYNMLLEDPYKFECEKTATNTITVLGVLPYDNSGNITLTPRKNQEITLKAYYRAPEKFYTDVAKGTYYATTKQYIEVTTTDGNGVVNTIKRDPKDKTELPVDVSAYSFGNWWYCTEEKQYYMVVPGTDLLTKVLDEPSATKPAASVLLKPAMDAAEESEIRVRWQIRTVDSSDWIDIYNEKIKLSDQSNQPFAVTTTMSSAELLVKFTISDPASLDELTKEETVLTTNTIGLSLVSDELATTINLKPIKYDLSTCSGMCEWEQRIVLWGVYGAENTIFVSDVNNPTFFPYPNNVDILPDPVLKVFPYGNELLALTATALYRLTWDTEGVGWTHKLVQRNLSVAQSDLAMCCVIKNMFFFKSGEYYYMMVPKSSSILGESTIAPISKPIEHLLDNFHDNVYELLYKISDGLKYKTFDDVWVPDATDPEVGTFKPVINTETYSLEQFKQSFIDYFVHTDGKSNIILQYTYVMFAAKHAGNDTFINVQLKYNIDTRIWTINMFETPKVLSPIEVQNLQEAQYIYEFSASSREIIYAVNGNEGAGQHTGTRAQLAIAAFSDIRLETVTQNNVTHTVDTLDNPTDYGDGIIYTTDNIRRAYTTASGDIAYNYEHILYYAKGMLSDYWNDFRYQIIPAYFLNNYQFLDTGNRDINTDMKKRFREFQFKMRNVNATSLGFHTSFLIDGSLRRDLQKYTPRYLTDPETGEMVIVIERTLDEASINYLSFVPAYKVTRVEYAVASTKMLQDDGELTPTTLAEYNDPDKWVIDQSAFPGRTFWKVRVSISGKGYTPRAQLLSTNLKYFEVFGHSWVYRTMHGR